jgi:hypothetical protein
MWLCFILALPIISFCQIPYLPGWPVETHGSLTSSITMADVDDDGQIELVYGDRSFGA